MQNEEIYKEMLAVTTVNKSGIENIDNIESTIAKKTVISKVGYVSKQLGVSTYFCFSNHFFIECIHRINRTMV